MTDLLTRAGAEAAFCHHRTGQLIPPTDAARIERHAARVFAVSGRPPLPVAVAAFVRGYQGVGTWLECNETVR